MEKETQNTRRKRENGNLGEVPGPENQGKKGGLKGVLKVYGGESVFL